MGFTYIDSFTTDTTGNYVIGSFYDHQDNDGPPPPDTGVIEATFTHTGSSLLGASDSLEERDMYLVKDFLRMRGSTVSVDILSQGGYPHDGWVQASIVITDRRIEGPHNSGVQFYRPFKGYVFGVNGVAANFSYMRYNELTSGWEYGAPATNPVGAGSWWANPFTLSIEEDGGDWIFYFENAVGGKQELYRESKSVLGIDLPYFGIGIASQGLSETANNYSADFDNLFCSNAAVPEPTIGLLAGIIALAGLCRIRRTKS
jgi:hypothetical protein